MTGTSAPTTTLAAAQAALTGHDAQRERWAGTVARLTAQLRTHETGAARAALDGTATGKLATDGGRLREELRIAEEAVALLDGEREEVAYGVRLAEQRDRRERYAALEAEGAALWARIVAAWAPVGELTGAGPEVCRDRSPILHGLTNRMETLRREINYRDDFLRIEDQGGVL